MGQAARRSPSGPRIGRSWARRFASAALTLDRVSLTADQRLPHHPGMDRWRFLLTSLAGWTLWRVEPGGDRVQVSKTGRTLEACKS